VVLVLLVILANTQLLDHPLSLPAKLALMSPIVTLVLPSLQHAHNARPTFTWIAVLVLLVLVAPIPMLELLPHLTARLVLLPTPDVLLVLQTP